MEARDPGHAMEIMTFGASSVRSGQKLPYATFPKAKSYIDKFLSLFPEAHIMHIVREPLETISSQVRKFKRQPRRCIQNYFSSVPQVHKYIKTFERSCSVCYENLVTEPHSVLDRIYTWMGQTVDSTHITKVISTKDHWDYNGRPMPGLRYFDSIIPKERTIVLKKSDIKAIKIQPLLGLETDF